MGHRGSSAVVQFRVTPELRDALADFAETNGLDSESAAARILLITILGVGTKPDAKTTALKAVAEEVIWSTLNGLREAIAAELPKLVARATKRVVEGG